MKGRPVGRGDEWYLWRCRTSPGYCEEVMSNLSFIFFMIGEQGSQISTFFVIIFGKASAELQGGMKSLLLHLCFPVVQPYWELKPVPTQNPVVQGGHGVLGSLLLPKQT